MKTHIIYILIVIFSASSCEVYLEDNQRSKFKVTVQDEDLNPIPKISLQIAVFDDSYGRSIFYSESGLLGADRTNEQGNASVLSLVPSNNYGQSIYFVVNADAAGRSALRFIDSYDNPEYGLVAYKLGPQLRGPSIVPTIILKRRSQLNITFSRTSQTQDVFSYKLTYEKPNPVIDLEDENLSEILDISEETFSNVEEDLVVSRSFKTLQKSTAYLTYQFTNRENSEPVTIEIPVQSNEVNYEFEY